MDGHVAGPGQLLPGGQDLDLRLGAVAPDDAAHAGGLGCGRQPGRQPVGVVHRGREADPAARSEEHTSELQSLMRISYAVFCLNKKKLYLSYIHHHTSYNTIFTQYT